MNINKYYADPSEKPLDNIVDDGGFAAIFRTFACVGDSLSSGEFETKHPDGNTGYHDLFEYSWAQYMARAMGSKAYNFSRGGMTGREYMESYAEANGFWRQDRASQAYIIAMGCNDISEAIRNNTDLGTISDIADDWRQNKKTFAGYYGAIVQRYKEIQPDAKFFFLTMPVSYDTDKVRIPFEERQRELMYEMAEKFPNSYVIDIRKYGPEYDEKFHKNFFLHGHLNPMGYLLTGKMVMSYIDYIIRNHPEDFIHAGLINSPFVDELPEA